MKALIRIQPKYRPVSGDLQGMRIQAALPNMAARKMVRTSAGFRATETPVPAFRKPYLVAETGDQSWFTENDLERFKQKLKWEGFSEFEMLTDLNGRKLEDDKPVTPAVQEQIDAMRAKLSAAAAQGEDALF
jgi:hypothetical protein